MAQYRSSLGDADIVGDDATGYILSATGSTPAEMAEGFSSVLNPEKLAILLAYAVRRAALLKMDLDNK